jgi:hypothetical protein
MTRIKCPYCGVPFDSSRSDLLFRSFTFEQDERVGGTPPREREEKCPNKKCGEWIKLTPKK